MKLSTLCAAGLLVGLGAGCSDQSSDARIEAQWSPSGGFALTPESIATLASVTHEEEIWVLNKEAGVSAPLMRAPDSLPATSVSGIPMRWPDVLVPPAIAPGTMLEVHAVEHGGVGPVLAKLQIVASGPEAAYYTDYTGTGSTSSCYKPCADLVDTDPSKLFQWCNWCAPCGGNSCGSIRNYNVTTPDTPSCNGTSYHAVCGGGTSHACWSMTWNVTCHGL
jgi:hypothetical protein